MKKLVTEKAGEEVYDFLSRFANLESEKTLLVSTTDDFNIINNPSAFSAIINLSKVNNTNYIC